MNTEILNRILSGSADKNIRFEDLRKLINSLSFNGKSKRRPSHIYKEWS